MTPDPMRRAQLAGLHAMATQVDVIDLAGAIIASPLRKMPSQAGQLAMAYALERMWEICLEAEVLVNALERTMPWSEQADDEDREQVATTAGHIRALMRAISQQSRTPEETNDGNGSGHP
jgi:hypothetical protein